MVWKTKWEYVNSTKNPLISCYTRCVPFAKWPKFSLITSLNHSSMIWRAKLSFQNTINKRVVDKCKTEMGVTNNEEIYDSLVVYR